MTENFAGGRELNSSPKMHYDVSIAHVTSIVAKHNIMLVNDTMINNHTASTAQFDSSTQTANGLEAQHGQNKENRVNMSTSTFLLCLLQILT